MVILLYELTGDIIEKHLSHELLFDLRSRTSPFEHERKDFFLDREYSELKNW